jgi:hypothetical protein
MCFFSAGGSETASAWSGLEASEEYEKNMREKPAVTSNVNAQHMEKLAAQSSPIDSSR